MRFSPWIMLFATSLSRKNHLFPKRKKRGTGYDISSAANFFLAIKWPWLLKLFANNMLNIVIKRKREFLDFFRFFSKNSNFWRKFKYVIWSIVYPWKANGLTVKMSMISQLIYQVWGALWMFSSIAAKFNPELAVCHMSNAYIDPWDMLMVSCVSSKVSKVIMSHATCQMNLGTCWTTFVFLSMLKSECL